MAANSTWSTQAANTSTNHVELADIANDDNEYHTVHLVIYSVVLLTGTISLSMMMHLLKFRATSTTSIAVLNLIFAHFIFLFTVPFRIYYYATSNWSLGFGWCRVVSSMIHIHMCMSFIFYVIILVTRLMTFHCKAERLTSPPKIYALIVSAVMWILVFIFVTCVVYFSYGKNTERQKSSDNNATRPHCFKFGRDIVSGVPKVFNYLISLVIIVLAVVLTALQANVLWVLYRKHHQGCTSQQDFGAQLKSLCFALIMFICFVPYQMFRLYYLEHIELQNINEVFLSLTTFNCLDMLTFLGQRPYPMCIWGNAI